MDVYDYDGVRVGWVKDVLETTFAVGRQFRSDLNISMEQVLAVLDQRVLLTVPHPRRGSVAKTHNT
jgi:hypothetical protein